MKKRFLSALLAAAMITTMAMPVSAESKDAEDDPGISTVSSSDEVDLYAAANDPESQSDHAAMIGNTGYDTLEDAIDAANFGDNIKMLADGSAATLKEGVTYDLNGKTLTCTAGNGEITVLHEETSFIDTSVSGSECGGTLNFPNITFTGAAMTAADAVLDLSNINFISNGSCVFVSGDATLNVTNCKVVSPTYCIGTNAAAIENYGVTINLKNSSFTSESSDGDNTAICFNVAGTLNIDDCQLTSGRQALIVRAGAANISNSVITTNGIFNEKDKYHSTPWKSGNEVPAAALTVGNYSSGSASAYKADAIVTVKNTKLIAKNEFPALYVDGNTSYKADVTLSGAETAVTGEVLKGQQKAEGAVNISITGGVFSTDVADHCAPGYIAEESNGVYIVKSGTNDTIAKVDAAIKDGALDDTIKDAVTAVASTPNAELSGNSAAMDKLTELEEVYNDICTGSNKITVTVEASTTEVPEVEVNKEAKNAALSAVPGDNIKINVAKSAATNVETVIKNAIQAETAPEVKALDITMTKNNEPTPIQPAAPVLLTFDMPEGWENAQIYRIESDTAAAIPTAINTDAAGKKTIVGTFDHFSTYGIARLEATANQNEYEFILTPDKTDVSAGDTLTYTVELKHTKGSDSDNIGFVSVKPSAGTGLTFDNASAAAGVATGSETLEFNNSSNAFMFKSPGAGHELTVGSSMTLGTISYTVGDCGNDMADVTINGTAQLTNATYQDSITPAVTTSQKVTYHEIEVTFEQDNNNQTYYAKYGEAGLYSDAGHTTPVSDIADPTDTSTEYRLLDNDWHAFNANGEAYVNGTTKFLVSTNYVINKIDILQITIPDAVEVTGTTKHPVTDRNGTKYVDKGADLTYTVKAPTTSGNKYDVTVKVNGNEVTSTKNSDGSYTVPGASMTASPVTFDVREVVDLAAEDIGIFTTENSGVNAFVQYSKYSGTDTLVLIKGKEGANYKLNDGQPTIYATSAYEGYTHAVLIPSEEIEVSEQSILNKLIGLGLTATDTANEKIDNTSWDTNGNGKADINDPDYGDIQAANDFMTFNTLKWQPSDKLLLLADVMTLSNEDNDKYVSANYTEPRDGRVSDADVNAFVYLYGKF